MEIARALRRQARVFILDEPTAALTRGEAEHLAALLRKLRQKGLAIALVSHHLDEVLALADRVTVLRDGDRVGTWPRSEMDHDRLVRAMVGREVATGPKRSEQARNDNPGPVLWKAESVAGETVAGVSLEIRSGEILGLTGLAGAGQEEVARMMAGESGLARGRMWLENKPFRPGHPAVAQRLGVVAVPADRRKRGLVAALGLGRNLVFQRMRQHHA